MGTLVPLATPTAWSSTLRRTASLSRRRTAEAYSSVGSAVSDALAPALLFVALLGMFGTMADLGAFAGTDYVTFLAPVGLLQAAGLAASSVGVGLARDIETGFMDRLRVAPFPLHSVLFADLLAGVARALLPSALVLGIAFVLGASWPGGAGMVLAVVLTLGFAMTVAGWSLVVALRTRSQGAAPLMQAPVILAIVLTPAFAPRGALASWLETVTRYNPVTHLVEAARAPFLGPLEWADAWPGLLVVVLGTAVMLSLSRRGLRGLRT